MGRPTALRWGVLSTAAIGRKVIPAIQAAERCEIVAIASRDPRRGRRVADAYGIPTLHASYEALLADPAVDAVYIPLPNHLHAEWAIAAARAGKHVLCEKPLATTSADAERMAAAAETAGVALMEAFMYRQHPSWVAVRELLAAGRIGQLVAVQSWFSFFNDDPANIRNIVAAGGGALYDICCS
jgi:predicted dehydrogenase